MAVSIIVADVKDIVVEVVREAVKVLLTKFNLLFTFITF